MRYFPRMLDKIRLQEKGQLRPDFRANLGHGADGWCCSFLRVNYSTIKRLAREGKTAEEIFSWCSQNCRQLNEVDLLVWNSFISKLGWNDFASNRLKEVKAESGLSDRDDIQTMGDYFDVDEGRRA
jgi:gluconokinase